MIWDGGRPLAAAAVPPPWYVRVQLLLLDRVQPSGAVVDPLPVQPHTQRAFVLVVQFLMPRPVAAGGPEVLQFLQPLLPLGLLIGFRVEVLSHPGMTAKASR